MIDEQLIIRKITNGWQVIRKNQRKGEVILATLCGGNMGKRLAIHCAKFAAGSLLIDDVVLEMGEHQEALK